MTDTFRFRERIEVRVNHLLLLFFTGEKTEVKGKVPEKFIDKLSGYLIND